MVLAPEPVAGLDLPTAVRVLLGDHVDLAMIQQPLDVGIIGGFLDQQLGVAGRDFGGGQLARAGRP